MGLVIIALRSWFGATVGRLRAEREAEGISETHIAVVWHGPRR